MTASRAALLVLVTMASLACACDDRDPHPENGPLRVTNAWARPADSGTTGGAYISVHNTDTMPVIITSVVSADAQSAELHETMVHDGMAHMTARPSVRIARDSTLSMVPGGLHVMLNGLTRSLVAGDTINVTLIFGDGRQVPARVAVRAP